MARPKVLAYYFPNYHSDPRNSAWFGENWTEWELVKAATPRFDGHQQPRRPLLGYQDEADPIVAAEHIALAAEHGIDGFIFDYYWYEDGPFLEGALERGFLRAKNNERLEFSLMWANHDWLNLFPSRDPIAEPPLLKAGAISRKSFEQFATYTIEKYFSQPNYTRIAGKPRFSIYEVGQFVRGLGGVESAADALQWFDERTKQAGFPGVHIDAVIWGFAVLPSEVTVQDPNQLLALLNISSASSYVWVHHLDMFAELFPQAENWGAVGNEAFAKYEKYADELTVPFHPNVSVGWDASPRCDTTLEFQRSGYPWFSVWAPSVEGFRNGLELAKAYSKRHPSNYQEVTINSWNEWTEGSYLLPDQGHNHDFLEAILEVFGLRE